MVEFRNSFFLDCDDLERLIKSYGYDDLMVKCVVEYLDESVIGDVYLSHYLKHRINNVKCFRTEEESINYVENELGKNIKRDEFGDIEIDDVRFYNLRNGVYVEVL